MEATVVDLRYHMKKVLQALDRNEQVKILYHGKVKGIIIPVGKKETRKIQDHPLFGMSTDASESVNKQMDIIRGGRYDDI